MTCILNVIRGLLCAVSLVTAGVAQAQDRVHPVGLRQVEFAEQRRSLALAIFYPAQSPDGGRPFTMPFRLHGATTGWCRSTCAASCRSMPDRR